MEVSRTPRHKCTCTNAHSHLHREHVHAEERWQRESDLVVKLECTQGILGKAVAELVAHSQVVLRPCYPPRSCLRVRRW
jgi:hypothetical protein